MFPDVLTGATVLGCTGLACAAVTYWATSRTVVAALHRGLQLAKDETQRARMDAEHERRARIKHEKMFREFQRAVNPNLGLTPLGTLRTMFSGRFGTPRQGSLASLSNGILQLNPSILAPLALTGLQKFSHCWLLFEFHENTDEHKVVMNRGKNFKALVRPPGMRGRGGDGEDTSSNKTGVLATRSPHRPNRIGLSLVKILTVDEEKGILVVSGVDILDGTPILDVKPFVPMDIPSSPPHYPDWVSKGEADAIDAPCEVSFEDGAMTQLGQVFEESKMLKMFFENSSQVKEALRQILQLDIRARHHGRFGASSKEKYDTLRVTLADMQVTFTVDNIDTQSSESKMLVTVVQCIWLGGFPRNVDSELSDES